MVEKNRRKQTIKYLIGDYLSALLTWLSFYFFRKLQFEGYTSLSQVNFLEDVSFFLGVLFVPLFWLLLYYLSGTYKHIYRKALLKEFGETLFVVTLGIIAIFFSLLLDDLISEPKDYYHSILYLWSVQFLLTYAFRLHLTARTIRNIKSKKIGFPAIIVGSNALAINLYKDLAEDNSAAGTHVVGYVTARNGKDSELKKYIPFFGTIKDLISIIEEHKIEEVLIAIDSVERDDLQFILTKAKSVDVRVKATPDLLGILSGHVTMPSLHSIPLLELSHDLLPPWQENLKRVMDLVLSILGSILLLPFILVIILLVRFSSKGPILYTHERLGRFGKPFKIYKFRTMYMDAEKDGPALSGKNDPRITPLGRRLRKVRLDEIPQFFNVIKGDMSLVGPRPERRFYADQIEKVAPHYITLFRVRPGITSWGQVKYGYAENVDQMVERLKYDLIYLENMSLYVDIKILFYTIRTVLQGKGQ